MNASHLATGGGIAALLGTIAVYVLSRYGIRLSVEDGTLIGGAAVAAGAGLAHRISVYGLKGIGSGLWNGNPKP